jgi:DNA invertase Pin-like site-specific DNA recombinase
MKIGIYCRISKEKEQGKDRSIDDQRLLGIELANKLGVEYEVYIDEGISGTLAINERPALFKLVQDTEENKISMFYYYDPSRLERDPETYIILSKLFIKKNVKCYTNSGEVVLNPESILLGTVMSAFNKFYVDITKQKVKSVLKRNAENGKVHAISPYGYKKNENNLLIIDEVQAEIIKRIYALSLSGVGTIKIARILNAENVPTKYNLMEKGGTISVKNKYTNKITTRDKSKVTWAGGTIRNIITNTIYKGVRVFSGVEYECPAIFDKHYWQKVNDNLKSNSNTTGVSTEHKYLLKGLLRCGRCGRNYYGRTRVTKKDNYYTCSSKRITNHNCGNRSLNIDILDEIIWSKFIGNGELTKLIEVHYSNINTSDIVDEIQAEIKVFERKLKVLDKEKTNILGSVRKGVFNESEVKSEMNNIRNEKDTLETKIYNLKEQLDSYNDSNNSIEVIVKDLDFNARNVGFNDKKDILNKYIKDIKIYYDDVKNYYIEIFFKVANMESKVFTIENNYKVAYEVLDLHKVGMQDFILLILDKKLELEFKNTKQIDGRFLNFNSKQMFEDLKLKHTNLML